MTVITAIVSLMFLFLTACTNEFIVTPKDVLEITVEDTSPQTEVIVEYFVQPSKPESLDVLFILDTSCSMYDDYKKVSVGMELLRGDIETLTHDYQMGIINTSLNEPYFSGAFDSSSSSIEFLLAPSLLGNDSREEGFTSHYKFATDTSEGPSFLRESVPKLYIYISDEEEQSSFPVSTFKEWLDEYHGEIEYDVITISIILDSDPSCMFSKNYIGYRYEELSLYFNKKSIDFCGDWQLALADSSFLLSEITHMQLSTFPIEDSIVVYQDGVKEEYWYYLSRTNTVYFEFDIDEGSIIKIGYDATIQ